MMHLIIWDAGIITPKINSISTWHGLTNAGKRIFILYIGRQIYLIIYGRTLDIFSPISGTFLQGSQEPDPPNSPYLAQEQKNVNATQAEKALY